jgi:hypothetical protein
VRQLARYGRGELRCAPDRATEVSLPSEQKKQAPVAQF